MQHEVELTRGVHARCRRDSIADTRPEPESEIVRDVPGWKHFAGRALAKVREPRDARLQLPQRKEAGSTPAPYERDVLRNVGACWARRGTVWHRQAVPEVHEIRGGKSGCHANRRAMLKGLLDCRSELGRI